MKLKTINLVLKKIKDSIGKSIKSANSVLQKFEAIDTRIKTAADQEPGIRNSMEEQNEGGRQVIEATSKINEITRDVKSEAKEMLKGSCVVIMETSGLEKTAHKISGGINGMVSGAERINIAVNKINDLCSKNREIIDRLVKEVSMFKVD